MIKKMYSNYEINKKYAIRKLSIGAFSIAIGLFASNMNELPVIGTNLSPSIVHAAEPEVTNWQPEGNIIAQGEDGVPWELYENGYLLFKPEPGKDTLVNNRGGSSWKNNYSSQIKAIGFTDKVYAPENSSYLFSRNNGFKTLQIDLNYIDASKIDTSKVEDMSFMFEGLNKLKELDVSKWNTSKVENLSGIFQNTNSLTSLDVSKWNTSKVRNMRGVFYDSSNLENIDVSNWDTSNVENMSWMFSGLRKIQSLNVDNWNTSKVKDMSYMFYTTYASPLKTLNVSNWNTSKVTNMSHMFASSSVENLDVSKWDTSNVEDMSGLFQVLNVKELDVSNWNTSKVTSMNGLFSTARIKKLDVSKWDTSKVTDMSEMFSHEEQLTYLDLSKWDTSNVINMNRMFDATRRLKKIKLGNNFKNTTYKSNLFSNLEKHSYGGYYSLNYGFLIGFSGDTNSELYTERWVKEDGSAGPYTIDEWNTAYRNDPVGMSGTWVREKKLVLTVNFNTGTNEIVNPLIISGDNEEELPILIEDKPGYKFLGWSKTEDGDIIKNKSEIGQPGETVTLYAKWEKVDNIRKENTPIEMTTVYEGDEELEKGTNKEINGVPGEKEIITTYEVTPITGELINPSTTENIITPMTPKTIKVGTKPKVVYTKQDDDVIKTTTRYTVNPNNGDITEDVTEEIVGRGTVADKVVEKRLHYGVEYERNDDVSAGTPNVIKQSGVDGKKITRTSYTVDPETGNITANEPVETIENPTPQIEVVGTKTEEIVTEQEFKKTYIGDETKEKGLTEVSVPGVNGKTVITRTYNLPENVPVREEQDEINGVKIVFNYEFNTAIPNDSEPSIIQPTNEIVKVGTRPKVVYSKNGDDIVKSTTVYTVDPNNGTISENTTKETFNKDGVKTKVEVTPIPSPNKYVKDDTREKGADNIIEQGTPGSKTVTTTYDVNPEDGSKIENVGNPVIVNPTDTIIKVAAKDKVEIVKEKGQIIERTTNYTVNEKTGEITETVTDKLISSSTPLIPNINGSDLPDEPELNTNEKVEYKESVSTNITTDEKGNEILPPVVDELPEYNGGANPIDSIVNEKPEYTGTLSTNTPIDENENPILPPVVEELPKYNGGANPTDSIVNEKPEYKGTLSTNTPVDENENPILPPIVDELPEYNGGVNPTDSPVNEKPEYAGELSTNTPVDENENPILPPVVDELPEYNGDINHTETPVHETSENIVPLNNSTVNNTEKSETTKEETKKERELPDTNSTSVIVGFVSSLIGTLGLGYKSKRRK